MLSMNILYAVMAFAMAMVLAMVVIPRLLIIAKKHSLYDPHDRRKTHTGQVPRIGGVSFVPCILFAMMLTFSVFYLFEDPNGGEWPSPIIPEFFLFASGLLLLYLGGIKDDLVGMQYHNKFAIQLISSLFIVFSGLNISNLHGLFGIYEVAPWIGLPLTVLALLFIINAINLIDGIDGLASGISLFALCVYGSVFLQQGLWYYAVLAFSTVGVLVPFFYYNVFGSARRGRKLFMGDSGSMILGLIIGFLAIRYISYMPEFTGVGHRSSVIALSPVLIPMLDVIRVMLHRARHKKGLFSADRSHIHHKLMDMGLSPSTALIILLCGSAFFCFTNFVLMHFMSDLYILLADIIVWSLLNIYFSYVVRKNNGVLHTNA